MSVEKAAEIIDGKKIASDIRKELKREIDEWVQNNNNRAPSLVAVLVGEDPASQKYVQNKMDAAKEIGISSKTINLESSITEQELLTLINKLNKDNAVDGILVQLPVPEHISERNICNAVDPRKDVDGFHINSVGKLCINKETFIPCTALAVVELLKRSKIDTFGKNVVVCGRSKNVGLPMFMLLHSDYRNELPGMEATVTLCHRNTPREELAFFAKRADVIVSATGVRNLITPDMVKPGACVIDVGIIRIKMEDGTTKLVGDVDFEGVSKVAGHITPVPGGVGPMTVAMLMKNTFQAAKGLRASSGRVIRKKICEQSHFSTMSRPKVYVTRAVNKEAMDILKQHCDVTSWPGTDPVPRTELAKNIEQVDGLYCVLTDKIDANILDRAKNLKVISTMSVGYDHLDVEEIAKRGIRIGYTPDVLTDATAELTVGLLLATCRRLMEAHRAAKNGDWATWSPFWMCGNSLKDSTVGFFGFGRIGQEIANRLKAFKTSNILYTARSEKPGGATRVTFDELLKSSDFLVVCCSYNNETKEIFDIEAFRKMKKNAVFINTSRGGVVKQDDLVVALKEKIIWGAGLDVTTPEPLPVDHPLFQLDNCVILPHIGSAATDCRNEMAALTARNIVAALSGQPMPSELKIDQFK